MLNRIFRSFALLLVVGFLATLFFHEVYSDSTPASRESNRFTLAQSVVNSIEIDINKENEYLKDMVDIRDAIVSAVGEIDKQGRMNAIQAIVGGFTGSEVAVVMSIVNQIDQTTTALDIVPQLEMLNTQIDEFYRNTITPMFTRGKATATEKIGYNEAWDNYIDAYNALSGQDLQDANDTLFGYDDQVNRVDWLQAQKETITPPELITVKPCNGVCGSFRLDADELKVTCGGCGEDYYSCDKKAYERHRVRYCRRSIIYVKYDPSTISWTNWNPYQEQVIGICGAEYRNCDNPKKKGHHYYISVVKKNPYTGEKYIAGWKSDTQSFHGLGEPDPPAVSINGPNGVGLSDSDFDDASPKCGSCLDGSKHCPDAGTKHPKTVPDRPKSFSVSKGSTAGSIELTWQDSDFDGGLTITDYEYGIKRWIPDENRYSSWVYSSAGTDNYEYISTGYSNAKYCIRMRAKNSEGYSEKTGIKIIYSK